MPDQLSALYHDLLEGSYDCVDRVVLNAYFGMGQTGGGLRVWWRALYGSDDNLDDNHRMRMAGRFSRRLRAWAKDKKVAVIYCSPGEDKHKTAELSGYSGNQTRAVPYSGVQGAGPGLGSAHDRHGQTRPACAQRSVALRQSLCVSYPGPGLGPLDDSDERPPAVRGAGDAERSRIGGLPGDQKP